MKLRGRIWLGLWLLYFLLISVTVVARQRAALRTAERLTRLEEERLALEASRADLERRIREGSSLQVLRPRAEALGLRMPTDAETMLLNVRRVRVGR